MFLKEEDVKKRKMCLSTSQKSQNIEDANKTHSFPILRHLGGGGRENQE